MTSHGENNACNCEECGSHFSNKNSLRVHMQKYHLTPAVKVTCEICGRQVKSMQNLKIHMQNHDKNRTRFECTGKCGQTFVDFIYMQRHYDIMRCGKEETNK